MRRPSTWLLALLALPAALAAQEPPPVPGTERWSWQMRTDGPDPVTLVQVRNDYGDIRVRAAGAPLVEGWAVIQRLGREEGAVGVSVERRGPAVVLTVTYGPGRLQDEDARPAKDAMDRLDLALFVPPGVRLEASTVRGLVEGRGLRSDVSARTVDEPITLATTGAVDARSETGDVTVFLQPRSDAAPRGLTVLHSASGAVTLAVPDEGLELRADTGGELTSELGGTPPVSGRRSIRVTPAKATGLAVATSVTGPVRLRRTEPETGEGP